MRRKISRKSDCSQAVNTPLNRRAKNSFYVLACAPSRTRTCGLLLRRQTRTRPDDADHSPYVALTWDDNRLTTPDAARAWLTWLPVWLSGESLAPLSRPGPGESPRLTCRAYQCCQLPPAAFGFPATENQGVSQSS